jgi:hypothetical protein
LFACLFVLNALWIISGLWLIFIVMEMSHHHAYFILDDIKTYFKYLRIYLVLLRPGKYNTLLQIAEETEKIILNFIFF